MAYLATPTPYLARLGSMVALPLDGGDPMPTDASAIAFVRFVTACPAPEAWAPGANLRGLVAMPGLLVATFGPEGRYGCADGSAHCGLLLRVVAPDPMADDAVAQAGFVELLEQPPHPPGGAGARAPARDRAAPPPMPWAPLRRRRLPFVRGDRRRLGGGPLADDADQYRVVELRRHAPLTPPGS
jgi:hypothetical protein